MEVLAYWMPNVRGREVRCPACSAKDTRKRLIFPTAEATEVSPSLRQDIGILADALRQVSTLRGCRFSAPYDWNTTLDGFDKLFPEFNRSAK
jgi:hypothetical protein